MTQRVVASMWMAFQNTADQLKQLQYADELNTSEFSTENRIAMVFNILGYFMVERGGRPTRSEDKVPLFLELLRYLDDAERTITFPDKGLILCGCRAQIFYKIGLIPQSLIWGQQALSYALAYKELHLGVPTAMTFGLWHSAISNQFQVKKLMDHLKFFATIYPVVQEMLPYIRLASSPPSQNITSLD